MDRYQVVTEDGFFIVIDSTQDESDETPCRAFASKSDAILYAEICNLSR